MQMESAITRAVEVLARMGRNRALRTAYEAEEKARMVDAATLEKVEQRGRQEGVQQGRQALLLRMMTRHIGEVPAGIQTRLGALTTAQLDDLGEALFDLNSYADVEAWLSRQ